MLGDSGIATHPNIKRSNKTCMDGTNQLYHHRGHVVSELEEPEDHGLMTPSLTPHRRDLALEWLSERIRKGSEKAPDNRPGGTKPWHSKIEAEPHNAKGGG